VLVAMYSGFVRGEVFLHARASAFRWLLGFLSGSSIGVLLGVITGVVSSDLNRSIQKKIGRQVIEDSLQFLRAIPIIGLPTVVIFVAGVAEWGKILIISWGCVFPVWLSTHRGLQALDPEYSYLARTFRLSRVEWIAQIVIPAVAQSVYSGLRIALAVGWITVVAAEWLGVVEDGWLGYGLGVWLWRSQENNSIAECMAILLYFGLLGIASDNIFSDIVRRIGLALRFNLGVE